MTEQCTYTGKDVGHAPTYYAGATVRVRRTEGYYLNVLKQARLLAEADLDTACAIYFDDQINTIKNYNRG